MPWFAIRTVYLFGTKKDGTNIFEERVVCFEADTSELAHEKATAEAAQYSRDQGFEAHPLQVGYRQDGDPMVDGYEVWSNLFQSRETLAEFYESHYALCEYEPDA